MTSPLTSKELRVPDFTKSTKIGYNLGSLLISQKVRVVCTEMFFTWKASACFESLITTFMVLKCWLIKISVFPECQDLYLRRVLTCIRSASPHQFINVSVDGAETIVPQCGFEPQSIPYKSA